MVTVWSQSRGLSSVLALIVQYTFLRPWIKALYDDYLCSVASNKQQIQWYEVKKQPQNLEMDNS